MDIASFSEWLASRNRELFRMARELENAAHKEKAREWRSRAFQNGSAKTRSDADAAHMRKASGIMQMR